MNYKTALKYTRYNSGSHFLDSGGAYGRIHQTPQPPQKQIITPSEGGELWDASINLTQLLTDTFEQEPWHLAQIRKIDGSWFEATASYLESKGYEQLARDNVYNGENDLDQVFIWEVWQRPGSCVDDWVWADSWDILAVVYVHTGCDVRGGYSMPLIGNFAGDYAVPFYLSCEWHVEATKSATDEELYLAESINDSGYLCCVYSHYPIGQIEKRLGSTEGSWKPDGSFHLSELPYVLTPQRAYMGE